MLDADALRAELAALEKKKAQLAAALQQVEGAIGFGKAMLAKAGERPPAVPDADPA